MSAAPERSGLALRVSTRCAIARRGRRVASHGSHLVFEDPNVQLLATVGPTPGQSEGYAHPQHRPGSRSLNRDFRELPIEKFLKERRGGKRVELSLLPFVGQAFPILLARGQLLLRGEGAQSLVDINDRFP